MRTLRVAAFQRRPRFADVAGTIDSLRADLAWCDGAGVELAVFPECYLQGYVLDRPSLERSALALPELQALLAPLAAVRTAFVLGLVEREEQAVFNTAALVRQGAVLGAYRKTHLHRKEIAFDAGSDVPIFSIGGRRFGINICYDANFPAAAASISRQGARLICYPLNNMLPPDVAERWRSKSVDNLRRRARETGCWVMSSDVVGPHEDHLSHGCTCIVSPAGEVVARAEEGCEGIARFDVNG